MERMNDGGTKPTPLSRLKDWMSGKQGIGEEESESEGGVAVEEADLREPPRYAVILHNDNYTTMEFVIEVLKRFFQKNQHEATAITLKIHHDGRGIAGIYGYEIAETKVAEVMNYSRQNGHPLRATTEELND